MGWQKFESCSESGHKKTPLFRDGAFKRVENVNQLAAATELVLELLDAASSVDEALLTGEGGVRVSSNVANHDLIFITVDCFCLAATHSGLGQELVACGNVNECDGI